jgi:hypothetical protein
LLDCDEEGPEGCVVDDELLFWAGIILLEAPDTPEEEVDELLEWAGEEYERGGEFGVTVLV